jgi:hypothetical protein
LNSGPPGYEHRQVVIQNRLKTVKIYDYQLITYFLQSIEFC